MDYSDRIIELSRYGWYCSQIIAKLVLEYFGIEDSNFVRSMGGLNGGIGFSGSVCGCLTAGVCTISYFTGKDSDGERESVEHKAAVAEFVEWFNEEMLVAFGGTECSDITGGNPAKRLQHCPGIIEKSVIKCIEILEAHNV